MGTLTGKGVDRDEHWKRDGKGAKTTGQAVKDWRRRLVLPRGWKIWEGGVHSESEIKSLKGIENWGGVVENRGKTLKGELEESVQQGILRAV